MISPLSEYIRASDRIFASVSASVIILTPLSLLFCRMCRELSLRRCHDSVLSSSGNTFSVTLDTRCATRLPKRFSISDSVPSVSSTIS